MHAKHAYIEGMVAGYRAQAQYGPCRRNTGFFNEGLEFCFRLAKYHTLAPNYKGFLCLIDQRGSLFYIFLSYNRFRPVASNEVAMSVSFVIYFLQLRILGDIYQYGTGPAGFCNMESFRQYHG